MSANTAVDICGIGGQPQQAIAKRKPYVKVALTPVAETIHSRMVEFDDASAKALRFIASRPSPAFTEEAYKFVRKPDTFVDHEVEEAVVEESKPRSPKKTKAPVKAVKVNKAQTTRKSGDKTGKGSEVDERIINLFNEFISNGMVSKARAFMRGRFGVDQKEDLSIVEYDKRMAAMNKFLSDNCHKIRDTFAPEPDHYGTVIPAFKQEGEREMWGDHEWFIHQGDQKIVEFTANPAVVEIQDGVVVKESKNTVRVRCYRPANYWAALESGYSISHLSCDLMNGGDVKTVVATVINKQPVYVHGIQVAIQYRTDVIDVPVGNSFDVAGYYLSQSHHIRISRYGEDGAHQFRKAEFPLIDQTKEPEEVAAITEASKDQVQSDNVVYLFDEDIPPWEEGEVETSESYTEIVPVTPEGFKQCERRYNPWIVKQRAHHYSVVSILKARKAGSYPPPVDDVAMSTQQQAEVKTPAPVTPSSTSGDELNNSTNKSPAANSDPHRVVMDNYLSEKQIQDDAFEMKCLLQDHEREVMYKFHLENDNSRLGWEREKRLSHSSNGDLGRYNKWLQEHQYNGQQSEQLRYRDYWVTVIGEAQVHLMLMEELRSSVQYPVFTDEEYEVYLASREKEIQASLLSLEKTRKSLTYTVFTEEGYAEYLKVKGKRGKAYKTKFDRKKNPYGLASKPVEKRKEIAGPPAPPKEVTAQPPVSSTGNSGNTADLSVADKVTSFMLGKPLNFATVKEALNRGILGRMLTPEAPG